MQRKDDYAARRQHLANLTEEELEQRFWELAEKIVNPLIELAYKHTSPSIERAVVMQMGFSSLEAKSIVDKTIKHGLLGKGAGHVVYRLAQIKNCSVREAGLMLVDDKGWDEVVAYFEGGGSR